MPATTQDLLRLDSEGGVWVCSPPTGVASALLDRRTRTTARTATARPSGLQVEAHASTVRSARPGRQKALSSRSRELITDGAPRHPHLRDPRPRDPRW